MTETLNRIFRRYAEAMQAVSDGSSISLDAANLSLALAIRDMADDHESASSTDVIQALQKKLSETAAHLVTVLDEQEKRREDFSTMTKELGDWLLKNKPDSLNGAGHIEIVKAALESLKALTAERDELAVKVAVLLPAKPTLTLTSSNGHHGNGIVINPPFEPSSEAQDYRDGLDAGRWKWIQVPKRIRLELVRSVIAATANHTQTEFDAARPSWMATATAHCSSFGVTWRELIDLEKEIEVKP
jgi:hypothetical protein